MKTPSVLRETLNIYSPGEISVETVDSDVPSALGLPPNATHIPPDNLDLQIDIAECP